MSDEELELLRENFLRNENGLISYLKNRSGDTDKIKTVLATLRKVPVTDLKDMIQKRYEDIEYGSVKEEDLEKAECELTLLLMCVPPDVKVVEDYWKQKMDEIKASNKGENGRVLIEIGAQHPLIDGKPGEEFAARLDRGIELYEREVSQGHEAIIFIPGSTHSIFNKEKGEWQTDSNSLSKAGYDYLIEHGIPAEVIRSDETNAKYKDRGVYNSGDEVFVSTSVANDADCGRVISVNSPVQLYRKALFYIQNGYKPEIYSVPLSNTYHNYIGELFWSLYVTYMEDHTWQNGFLAEKTRQERNVNYPSELSSMTEEVRGQIASILEDGLNLPECIYSKKAEWLARYKNASESMAKRKDCPNVLIDAEFSHDNFDEEMDMLCEAIEKSKGKNCIVCADFSGIASMNEVQERLQSVLDSGARVGFIDRGNKEISQIYNDMKCSDLYIVCSADKTIRRAVQGIESGIIPQVFAVPTDKDDFVSEISNMYKYIINGEKNVSLDSEQKLPTNTIFEDIDWTKIMENEQER